jgi:hypothetical protein
MENEQKGVLVSATVVSCKNEENLFARNGYEVLKKFRACNSKRVPPVERPAGTDRGDKWNPF